MIRHRRRGRSVSTLAGRSVALPRRRGLAAVWMVAAIPVLLWLLVMVTDLGRLWLARQELKTAAEAAALAGAKVWGDSGDESAARTAAVHFFASNLVQGQFQMIAANDDPAAVNGNAQCPGDILLGDYDAGTAAFHAETAPASADRRACRVAVSIALPSLWGQMAGPYALVVDATARYTASGRAVLVRPQVITCD